MMTLRQCLAQHDKSTLVQLARWLPSPPTETTKTAQLDAIEAALESEWLRELVCEQLDELEQLAIAHMVHERWDSYDELRFNGLYDESIELGETTQWGIDDPPMVRLLIDPEGQLPEVLRPRLAKYLDAPAHHEFEPNEPLWTHDLSMRQTHVNAVEHTVETIIEETEQRALQEVQRAMALVKAGKFQWTAKSKMPTANTRREVRDNVLVTHDYLDDAQIWAPLPDRMRRAQTVEPVRVVAWPMLVLHGRWVKRNASNTGTLTPRALRELSGPPQHIIKALWEGWLNTTTMDELARITTIKGHKKNKRQRNRLPERRHGVVQCLKQCPVNEWVDIHELIDLMFSSGDYPIIANGTTHLFIKKHPLNNNNPRDRRTLAILTMYVLLIEYAGTLGLVDLAITPPQINLRKIGRDYGLSTSHLSLYDGLHGIRLTPLGAWVLGQTQTYNTPTLDVGATIKLVPNGDIVVLTPSSAQTQAILDTFASPLSANAWNLNREKLLQAITSGAHLSTLRAFLEQCDGDIPRTIELLLEDVTRRAQSIEPLGPHRVLYIEDAILLKELAHHSKIRAYCTPAGPHHLIVPEEHFTRFRSALIQVGFALGTL